MRMLESPVISGAEDQFILAGVCLDLSINVRQRSGQKVCRCNLSHWATRSGIRLDLGQMSETQASFTSDFVVAVMLGDMMIEVDRWRG